MKKIKNYLSNNNNIIKIINKCITKHIAVS